MMIYWLDVFNVIILMRLWNLLKIVIKWRGILIWIKYVSSLGRSISIKIKSSDILLFEIIIHACSWICYLGIISKLIHFILRLNRTLSVLWSIFIFFSYILIFIIIFFKFEILFFFLFTLNLNILILNLRHLLIFFRWQFEIIRKVLSSNMLIYIFFYLLILCLLLGH